MVSLDCIIPLPFLKILFIYLTERAREYKQGETAERGEGFPLSREPDVGLRFRILGSPESRTDTQPTEPPRGPQLYFFFNSGATQKERQSHKQRRSPMRGSIPGLQDHAPDQRQVLNRGATRESPSTVFLFFFFFFFFCILILMTLNRESASPAAPVRSTPLQQH